MRVDLKRRVSEALGKTHIGNEISVTVVFIFTYIVCIVSSMFNIMVNYYR